MVNRIYISRGKNPISDYILLRKKIKTINQDNSCHNPIVNGLFILNYDYIDNNVTEK